MKAPFADGGGLVVEVGVDDAGALAGEADGGAMAHPAGGAGDDSYFVIEPAHSVGLASSSLVSGHFRPALRNSVSNALFFAGSSFTSVAGDAKANSGLIRMTSAASLRASCSRPSWT
jgi:hypothetical protein